MFIPKDQRHMYKSMCNVCTRCEWCHDTMLRRNAFKLIDGPGNFFFCDVNCSTKWVKYRHDHRCANVIKLDPKLRKIYLDGKSMDEFISNFKEDENTADSNRVTGVCYIRNREVSLP